MALGTRRATTGTTGSDLDVFATVAADPDDDERGEEHSVLRRAQLPGRVRLHAQRRQADPAAAAVRGVLRRTGAPVVKVRLRSPGASSSGARPGEIWVAITDAGGGPGWHGQDADVRNGGSGGYDRDQ
jgi:hypothetical protein